MKAVIENVQIIEKPRGSKIYSKGEMQELAYLPLLG